MKRQTNVIPEQLMIRCLLGIVFVLAGCGPAGGTGALKVGVPDGVPAGGCYTAGTAGVLVTDASAGTAVMEKSGRMPIMWPPGFTSRQVGGELAVIDTRGEVVAITGRSYNFMGGYTGEGQFWACGEVGAK